MIDTTYVTFFCHFARVQFALLDLCNTPTRQHFRNVCQNANLSNHRYLDCLLLNCFIMRRLIHQRDFFLCNKTKAFLYPMTTYFLMTVKTVYYCIILWSPFSLVKWGVTSVLDRLFYQDTMPCPPEFVPCKQHHAQIYPELSKHLTIKCVLMSTNECCWLPVKVTYVDQSRRPITARY